MCLRDDPERRPPVPHAVRDAYRGWSWTLVYQGSPRAATYRLVDRSAEVRFVKLVEHGWAPGAAEEGARMRWAEAHLPVPRVLEEGADDVVSWLITTPVPGLDATHESHLADPRRTVRLLAEGLRRFHEAPAADCPFDFTLDRALALARRRLEAGLIVPERDFHDEFAHLTAEDAVTRLERTRPHTETLVVCHGDYCLPNVLVHEGRVSGFVDLGELGVADRWWDLAVATWSVTWNLGPGLEQSFLSAYGATDDPERLAFYRLLYDVVS